MNWLGLNIAVVHYISLQQTVIAHFNPLSVVSPSANDEAVRAQEGRAATCLHLTPSHACAVINDVVNNDVAQRLTAVLSQWHKSEQQ